MRILALDIGDRRIGVAMSDPVGILATPHSIIGRTADADDMAAIVKILEQYQIKKIVVGFPIKLDGNVGDQAIKVQVFVEHLVAHTGVPVEYRDERMSTVSARRLMQQSRTKKVKQKVHDDAAAAAVILQSYLDEQAPSVDL
ncbi:MAG: Holliday junction resolvase RuvX [Dehalococcoidia bacterium]|nr:MAG: Holliday junction resolvase RuvX [Dehalococcoidia bacterium]